MVGVTVGEYAELNDVPVSGAATDADIVRSLPVELQEAAAESLGLDASEFVQPAPEAETEENAQNPVDNGE